MSTKNNPTWIEINKINDQESLINLINKHELIFDNWELGIYLFGKFIKLRPQEYNFLYALFKQNGKRTKAEKIMLAINAKCNSAKYSLKSLSYRIKAKIKSKILKAFKNNLSEKHKEFYIFSSPSKNEWIILDDYYKENGKFFQDKSADLQYLNLNIFINEMIHVKNGFYLTIFRKGKI